MPSSCGCRAGGAVAGASVFFRPLQEFEVSGGGGFCGRGCLPAGALRRPPPKRPKRNNGKTRVIYVNNARSVWRSGYFVAASAAYGTIILRLRPSKST